MSAISFSAAYAAEASKTVEAITPEALAFEGVTSKMAVGETQQLDVRITKAQMHKNARLQ